jgi:hypothetical protein
LLDNIILLMEITSDRLNQRDIFEEAEQPILFA